MATSGSGGTAFEQGLANFKAELRPKQRSAFQNTTLPDLLAEINKVQEKQHATRRLQAVGRLKPTLEALNQLGKVVETFVNTSEIVAFIWGPLKLLIQIASSLSEAFTELLSVYESLGEELPLVQQYERLFSEDPNMKKVLSYLYKDVLEFHRRALRYFQQPIWKQVFQATWKTYKSRFDDLISGITRHRDLMASQANLSLIETSLYQRKIRDQQFKAIADAESSRKLRELYGWLRAPCVANDQQEYSKLRAEYPGTGRWLLSNTYFKEWFEPLCQSIPPVLWLNGIPGAGKTILASLVVEEAQKLGTSPVVLYFFCKSGDNERDNFVSIARSCLAQLLPFSSNSSDILLPYYHDSYLSSGEAVLTSQSTIEKLLKLSLQNFANVYIILDGVDECPRKERETISSWFRSLVESLPQSNPIQIRCLFVSQDDGPARRDFVGVSAIKIQSQDNQHDIEQFSTSWASKIQKKFDVSNEKRQSIACRIVKAAEGMFLLAKLISTNLFHQLDVDDLDYELEPGRFPREINDAYSRIIDRVFKYASESTQRGSTMLLTWLVCAKRSMKWHEIQGAKSINVDRLSVDYHKLRFRVDSKDLCGSLVEIRFDGTVELVHLTAKLFLISEKHVCPVLGDLQLASLCVDYLNFPGFTDELENMDRLILEGYYAFMDYAVTYWVRHLEACLVFLGKEDSGVVDISGALENFIELHYTAPATRLPITKRNAARLRCLEGLDCYDELQRAVRSTRKQLSFYGELDEDEVALDLGNIVKGVREALEKLVLKAQSGDGTCEKLEKYYGSNLFKCPRLSCKFFSNGFATATQRDQHLGKHQRPFRCTVSGCPNGTIGMSSERELQKHTKEAHGEVQYGDEFPDEDEEIAQSPFQALPTRLESPAASSLGNAQENHDSESDVVVQSMGLGRRRLRLSNKRRRQYKCQHCGKIFHRKFNLDSHLHTHSTERSWNCGICSKAFAREGDYKRHIKGHSDAKSFKCGGCGRGFARRDTLATHYKSRMGRSCLEIQASQS